MTGQILTYTGEMLETYLTKSGVKGAILIVFEAGTRTVVPCGRTLEYLDAVVETAGNLCERFECETIPIDPILN